MPANPNGDSPSDMFVWKVDGVTITMPSARRIKSGTLRRLRGGSEIDLMYGVLEEILPPKELAKTDDLDLEQLQELFAAWQKAGANLGEVDSSSI